MSIVLHDITFERRCSRSVTSICTPALRQDNDPTPGKEMQYDTK